MPQPVKSAASLAHMLRGINYPAGKQSLLAQAQRWGADCDTLNMLQTMPDREYRSLDDVLLTTKAS